MSIFLIYVICLSVLIMYLIGRRVLLMIEFYPDRFESDLKYLSYCINWQLEKNTKPAVASLAVNRLNDSVNMISIDEDQVIEFASMAAIQIYDNMSGPYKKLIIYRYFRDDITLKHYITTECYLEITQFAVKKNTEKYKYINKLNNNLFNNNLKDDQKRSLKKEPVDLRNSKDEQK